MENNNILIGLGLGLLASIFILIKYFVLKTDKVQRHVNKAKKNGCVVEANYKSDRVLTYRDWSAKSSNRIYDNYLVTYEYIVNGKKYVKKLVYEDKFPNSITVYYDKSNPKKAYAASENASNNRVQKGCTQAILAPVIVTILFMLISKLFH